VPKAAEYTFHGCAIGIDKVEVPDEQNDGALIEVFRLTVSDPGEPALYRLLFRDDVKEDLIASLTGGVIVAPADIHLLDGNGN